MSSSDNNIVFSFQGAFGPPTWGHYMSMKLFAIAVLSDYSDRNIIMLFMPTAKSSSKPHLALTQDARMAILKEFCRLLKTEPEFADQRIEFDVSTIEYNLAKTDDPDPRLKSGNTIVTIDELVKGKSKPDDKILLGIGFDNMMQLPYWAEVDKYKDHVDKIYVSYRTLSTEEIAKTKVYTITEDVSDEKPKLRFDTKIPTFLKKTDIVVKGFGLPIDTSTIEMAQDAITKSDDDNFRLPLPSIKIVGQTGETSEIPATSSSMMRYFIKKYIQASSIEDVGTTKQYKQKIKNTMFGPIHVPETWDDLFSTTIEDYKNPENYKKIFPELTGQALTEEEAKDVKYEKDYSAMFPDTAAAAAATAAAAPGGGARSKKTKRRKGVKGGRRSKTRKRRLTNKRRGNRRRNRTHH
jgi:nicotinic acid mononucleotide adenylyltransferase